MAPWPRVSTFLSPVVFLRQGCWCGGDRAPGWACTGLSVDWVGDPRMRFWALESPPVFLPRWVLLRWGRRGLAASSQLSLEPITSHSQGRNAGSGPGIQMCTPSPRLHLCLLCSSTWASACCLWERGGPGPSPVPSEQVWVKASGTTGWASLPWGGKGARKSKGS